MKTIINLLKAEEGTTSIEYGIIGVLISIVAIAAITSIGGTVNNSFSQVGSAIGTSR